MSREIGPGRSNRPVAFFDIDGTLTDGFTIFSFAEFLREKDLFLPFYFNLMQQDRTIYQSSKRGEQNYHEFAVDLVDHYALGLKGQAVEHVGSLSSTFVDAALEKHIEGYRIQSFAKDLVELVNPVVRTVAISGSPWEALSGLTAYLDIQEVHATLLEVKQGRFTGRVERNLALRESKGRLVSSYLDREINLNTSFAFGDSVQDVPLLETVGNPFVLGDNQELQSIARHRGWHVVPAEGDVVSIVRARIAEVFGV